MSTLVIEHLKASDLPHQWVQQLKVKPEQTVTVRIDIEPKEAVTKNAETFVTDDPAFGIWRDRKDISDVEAYVRKLRAPRYNPDGSRNEK